MIDVDDGDREAVTERTCACEPAVTLGAKRAAIREPGQIVGGRGALPLAANAIGADEEERGRPDDGEHGVIIGVMTLMIDGCIMPARAGAATMK